MEEEQIVPPPGGPRTLEVRFTGSGSEYFRIWIVNLLLTIVTLGLYYPWAKVRRLRYFHGNTLVGGHALDFHGDPKKMLRGFLLAGALVLLYTVSGQISPLAGIVAVLAMASAFPALLWAALRFRLANTSWRGMRMRFVGTVSGAYLALGLAVVPLALFVGIGFLFPATDDPEQLPDPALGIAALIVMVLALALAPLMFWLFKRYQHGNLALGEERSRLAVGPGAFYGLAVKVVGLFVLALVVLIAGPVLALGGPGAFRDRIPPLLLLMFGYLMVIAIAVGYATSRLQNLLWSNTASTQIRFSSALRVMPYIRLAIKNMVLVIVTLGFYWPYAATAMARMRLEAMAVQLDIPPDELASTWRRDDDAAGDAAGDLLGIDIGF